MEKTEWTSTDIFKTFRMNTAAWATLAHAEKSGQIPKAERIRRGRIEVRHWTLEQIPAIGARFGFLKPPKTQRIICVYTPKGGVLKSTISYTLGRMLALHGIRTLLVGLDLQGSLTDLALNPLAVESLEQVTTPIGLADMAFRRLPLESIIVETNLPTLDIIPETPGLLPLEKHIRDQKRREYFLRERVIEPLGDEYDVVIFDNSPNYNMLIENSLVASNVVISPVGCDLGTYQAIETNMRTTLEVQKEMKIKWDNVIVVPTLRENTKISAQIYAAYLNLYPDYVTHRTIRRAVKGQEALASRQTPLEYDPKSELASDYYELGKEVWERVLSAEK